MQGPGVTNYHVDKPSYSYTASTTQFDDALLQRGVVNRTQTIVAKGASVDVAQELLRDQAHAQQSWKEIQVKYWNENGNHKSDDDDDDDSYSDLLNDEEDDKVLERYRQLRLSEMQQPQLQERLQVELIHRDEWIQKVNEASRHGMRVIICLTTTSSNQESFLHACTVLAQRHGHAAKFVTLPATQALGASWPHPEPSLLVYRYGKLSHEFFRLTNLSASALESILSPIWLDE